MTLSNSRPARINITIYKCNRSNTPQLLRPRYAFQKGAINLDSTLWLHFSAFFFNEISILLFLLCMDLKSPPPPSPIYILNILYPKEYTCFFNIFYTFLSYYLNIVLNQLLWTIFFNKNISKSLNLPENKDERQKTLTRSLELMRHVLLRTVTFKRPRWRAGFGFAAKCVTWEGEWLASWSANGSVGHFSSTRSIK